MDIAAFNARWLKAWSDKDVEHLLEFYSADCSYTDQQVPMGLIGRDALRGYLTGLFAATPPMRYDPDEVWPTPTGFCGRWMCVIGDDPKAAPALRGFDLVVLKDGLIALNEVYTHVLAQPAA
jgi:hypothetical protein